MTSSISGENVDFRGDNDPRAEKYGVTNDRQASRLDKAPLLAPASAQVAKAVRATENTINRVDAEFGFLSSQEVGQRLGSRLEDAEETASHAREDGSLLAIRQDMRDRFPAFQFQHDGAPRPVIRALRDRCSLHGWSEFDLFLWLVAPTTRFVGARPVDLMLAEAPASDERLLSAAEMERTTEW